MASGKDVKEPVMTIPFLRTCLASMISALEKRHTAVGNKRRALPKPEAPWQWFTSYELGFPVTIDKHEHQFTHLLRRLWIVS